MKCERCDEENHLLEKCDYCQRNVCRKCEKSSKRASKTKRLIICKDCWGKMDVRKKYKTS